MRNPNRESLLNSSIDNLFMSLEAMICFFFFKIYFIEIKEVIDIHFFLARSRHALVDFGGWQTHKLHGKAYKPEWG